jgi:protoporphyrinogen oxidase
VTRKTAIIIGAGPAGLTTALELLERTDIVPIVYEASGAIGGISQTITYKGNRMDIGGHRFFSKSDRVMDWWQKILPIQGSSGNIEETFDITYRRRSRAVSLSPDGPNPNDTDEVMLIRERLSRIYYLGKFFDYPVELNTNTIRNLGPVRIARIGLGYVRARLRPIKPEKSLEDFMINRFGTELYRTFFKDYTEKVWGVDTRDIDPSWGGQRIKGLSIAGAIKHAVTKPFKNRKKDEGGIGQKGTETSLIERFMYPKYGPGQIWEVVAEKVKQAGGEVHLHHQVNELEVENGRIVAATVVNGQTGESQRVTGDYVFSTQPVNELIRNLGDIVPESIRDVSEGLMYRDFITVGVLLNRLALPDGVGPTNLVPDNWIYIQERDVKVGRLQIFNNWSPYLVADQNTVWVGMEYFCNEGDELWSMDDETFFDFATKELAQIGIIDLKDVLDGTVVHVKKTYPAYFGTYDRFPEIIEFVDTIENLYLLGRNGMHRYNNADHSMLTAMTAVDNIVAGRKDKANIWSVNTEDEYHEEK